MSEAVGLYMAGISHTELRDELEAVTAFLRGRNKPELMRVALLGALAAVAAADVDVLCGGTSH